MRVPPVRFELTTARSSASPCEYYSRVLFQAELRRHNLKALFYIIYIIALLIPGIKNIVKF